MDDQTELGDGEGRAGQTGEGGRAKDYRAIKLDKLRKLQEAGADPFREVRYDRTHCAASIEANFDGLEGKEVSLAGRIVAKRLHGKAGFADLIDESGRVQLYFKQDNLGEESFARFNDLDLGDIIGLAGSVMKTRSGQVTVAVSQWTLLAKILQTLPEKWHGLADIDARYRQRYADMIVNREVLGRLRQRGVAVSEIRRFLDGRGFIEVETPILHAVAGGATAEPFVTHWNVLKADYYLRIAIELHLKRLIVGGMEKVYELGRIFRNEGISTRHNPEFTMLELYWAYVDYNDIMQLTEDLVMHLVDNVFKERTVQYGDHELKFTPPFARMTFDEAMRKWAGAGLDKLKTLDDVKREAARLGLQLPEERGYAACLDEIFKEKVEPELVQPTFVYDYPTGLSPLAKRHPGDPALCYRFELFIATMELANSFSELNDPDDQRKRLETQVRNRVDPHIASLLDRERQEWELQTRSQQGYTPCDEIQEPRSQLNNLNRYFDLNKHLSDEDYEQVPACDRVPWMFELGATMEALGVVIPELVYIRQRRNKFRRLCSENPFAGSKEIVQAIEKTDDFPSFAVDEDFLTALEYGMPPTGGLGLGIDRLIMVLSGITAIREVIAFPQLRQK